MTRTDLLAQWDQSARSYAEFEAGSPYARCCRELVTNRFADVSGWRVLDAGCGNGVYTGILRRNGADVTGCDGSAVMLELAKASQLDCRFDMIDLLAGTSYADNEYDAVICNLVLMDIDPIDNVLTEFHRILKENGVFFFSIVHPAFYHATWENNEQGMIDGKKIRGYLTEFSMIQNAPWGQTAHYHRPISYYLNKVAAAGFQLTQVWEPRVYEDAKIPDIPLYLFAEGLKTTGQ